MYIINNENGENMLKKMLKKIIYSLFLLTATISSYPAFAVLSMELTQGVSGAIPIAIVPFLTTSHLPQDVSAIIANDLQNSGRFKVYGKQSLTVFPSDSRDVAADYFRRLGTDNVVVGKIVSIGADRYQISFELLDMFHSKEASSTVLAKRFTATSRELRAAAHHVSDLIYQHITGVRGIFSTKLIYVLVQNLGSHSTRYSLEVADQDGYSPRHLLNSFEPIMSPAWSPNGRQVAYVSFEKHRAGIYLQEVSSGVRRLLSEFPGINGAPAWSPDGRKLALVLSKSGSPNIYIMDIVSRQLTQLTHDFYINTEPAWSPDGKSLLYTSNRSGNPQIYQINLSTGDISRISFDGDYNARASFTRDSRHIAMIHRVSGIYNIGILDLDTGKMRVLNSTLGDSSSPSIAPNGSMVLYDMISGGRSVLGMASSDGRVQLMLPARQGEAQDPAWSPYLG
jgi:TolB protein